MKLKVLVSVPNGDGWIHKHVVSALMGIQRDARYSTTVIMPTHSPNEHNRHLILNDFMNGDFDWWLSIDSDNPPQNNPLDLIELNKDIIGCPTPVWHCADPNSGERPYYFNAYDWVEEKQAYREHMPYDGLQEVDAIGFGCFLFKRRVFENIEMRKAPFQREFHLDGSVHVGLDLAFSKRAKAQGFKIYAHYDYPCKHFNEIEIGEIITSFVSLKHG